MRVDHVQLTMPPGQEEKARNFYREILGMREDEKPERLRHRGGCWFRSEGAVIHVGVEERFVPEREGHIAFTVEAIDRLAAHLENQNHLVDWDKSLPHQTRFYTSDPFGNRLEFIQAGQGFNDQSGTVRKQTLRSGTLSEITLYPKKTKYLLISGICFMFVIGGIFMAIEGDWVGYLSVAFFGLGIPICLFQILPGSSYLRLGREGFEHSSLYRKKQIKWNDIADFGVFKKKQSGITVLKSVGFNYIPSYSGSRMMRNLNRRISGFEGALPDNFGKKTEELLILMESYWKEANQD